MTIINDKVIIGKLEFKIFKRMAIDVIELAEFARKESSDTAQIFQMAKIVSDSLKRNIQLVKWWQFIRYILIKNFTKIENILKNFSIDEINEIALKVLEAEGLEIDTKKKVEPAK